MNVKVIKDYSEYEAALTLLSELMDKKIIPGSDDENTIELLLVVLKDYEQKNLQPLDIDPIEAIKFRMEQLRFSQKDLIPFLGTISKVSEVLSGKRKLSLSMIRKLHKGLEIPLESLIGRDAEKSSFDSSEIDYTLFPLKEMNERGCFGQVRRNLKELNVYAEERIKEFCGSRLDLLNQNGAFLRAPLHQRGNRKIDRYALSIWQICVLKKVENMPNLPKYDKQLIDEAWLSKLVKLSTYEEGPRLVKEHLQRFGIAFVIEAQFKKTYLDGAAMMFKDRPIIALTLRHNRVDNFWFVLAHEIAHLIKHVNSAMPVYIDDLETKDELDAIELEADSIANEALIPKAEWEKSKILNTRSEREVLSFAQKIQINPAIVAGRIRYERKNYRIFPKLVSKKAMNLPFS
jgi:HTH-type transcriptional regulator / antitoxin HigA